MARVHHGLHILDVPALHSYGETGVDLHMLDSVNSTEGGGEMLIEYVK